MVTIQSKTAADPQTHRFNFSVAVPKNPPFFCPHTLRPTHKNNTCLVCTYNHFKKLPEKRYESEAAIPMLLVSAATCVRIPWASDLSRLVSYLHANGSKESEANGSKEMEWKQRK